MRSESSVNVVPSCLKQDSRVAQLKDSHHTNIPGSIPAAANVPC